MELSEREGNMKSEDMEGNLLCIYLEKQVLTVIYCEQVWESEASGCRYMK